MTDKLYPRLEAPQYNVVLLGSQNPAIHHPYWYKEHGWLTEAECQQAINGEFVCLPVAAQFVAGPFRLSCDEARWILAVSSNDHLDRLIKVSADVWRRLRDTPISALGINYEAHLVVNTPTTSVVLSSLLNPLLGESESRIAAKLAWTIKHADRAENIRLEPSVRDQKALFVHINHHRRFASGSQPEYIAVEDIIRDRAKCELTESIAAADRLASIIEAQA